jgi:transcription antitermination factor NusG
MDHAFPFIALLAVRTGSEASVRDQLKARAVSSYLPRYLVNIRNRGLTARPLFPGYLFAWANPSSWPVIRVLPGVRDLVRRGSHGEVEPVPPRVIEDLRAREGPTGYVRIDPTFVVGQVVTIRNRNDWSGVYLGTSNAHKARVLMRMLGAPVTLECFESDLVAV